MPVDPQLWERIVLNLLSNAFKHTFAGTVSVGLALRRSHVELTVADTGPGIAEDQVPQLFTRFHRVPGVRARSSEGTGLGLALVRELARLHRGSVRVRSTVGRGSEFTVWVPLAQPVRPRRPLREGGPAPEVAVRTGREAYVAEAELWAAGGDEAPPGLQDAPAPSPALPGRRPVVLLVDGDADMRAYVARVLADRFEVVTAASGGDAIGVLDGRAVDVVVGDVALPERDGLELLARLRADPGLRSAPVILLTALAGAQSALAGLAAGAHDYVVKPFTARELVARVEGQLALARMRTGLAGVVPAPRET